jgi:hypothetical protein
VKFLCLSCDQVMPFSERALPGDGTFTAVFSCPGCGREIAMLANPMETQLVSSLGVEIGGRTVPEQPFQQTRTGLGQPRDEAFAPAPADGSLTRAGEAARVTWSADAAARLDRVPNFVRGMVKRIYTDYARERAIPVVTTDVMDRARTELGLEGM